ncbi:hypothetical protein C499_12530 [Halogeometricum borinquense DSM 11551]|uniref:DUF4013 domain-containing protein n=2 Tax=Halogeometricum borinquense TaxID=60847 RepID=E4NWH7_HALBP|nr:DUF4013 domain-containing protein [Halogeometricum borinquense]ADQ69397.1 hypothetical protein Hbor_36910 [Halogeometricum borinquense DSM 11551]ELY25950.1 hypothetical protein C499_12530 [Halogeometricum borinquense DSM 11551]RYJ19437.1 DUF4013 domain-containing protein [Halogeometricum borinquense]
MLEEGISYPLDGDNALGRIVIGSLLIFGFILVVPVFLLYGYLVRVLEATAHGKPEPPAFDDWGKMFVDGLKAFGVTLVYGFVPFALMGASLGVGLSGGASGSDTAAGLLGGIGALGFGVSFFAMFIIYYLVPAALTNMAVEDSFGAAFDISRLKDVLLSADYFVAWIIPFLLAFVAYVLTGFLVAITIGIGTLLVPTIQFYTNVAVFYMFGRAFGKVTGIETTQSATPADAV